MSLSREEVERVALLARLRLSADEAEQMARQLGQMVDYFRELNQVDTAGVEPMAHAGDLRNAWAADELQASLPREVALSNAPKHDQECYRVPAVLGE